mgnify:CR=1 FL=1
MRAPPQPADALHCSGKLTLLAGSVPELRLLTHGSRSTKPAHIGTTPTSLVNILMGCADPSSCTIMFLHRITMTRK